jgi:hypothetical protein
MFALVMAFLNLLNFPFGTALGVYTLFVLLPDAAGDEYRQGKPEKFLTSAELSGLPRSRLI